MLRKCEMAASLPRLRIAVIGQGHFAQSEVLPAIDQLPDVQLAALVSGSRTKLDELGLRYGAAALGDYRELDSLLGRNQIDIAYIAVPTDLHAEMTVIAARHGCHVLCEKPMAPTEAECLQMIRACEQKQRKLMIAYRLHFEAANLCAIEIARSGELGDLRIFSSVFAQQVKPGNVRLEGRRGGGPLYDIGVYCINAARYLFRTEPTEASAIKLSGRDPRFANTEEAYGITLRFPDERVAQFTCSFGAHEHKMYQLIGSEGVLTLDHAYDFGADMHLTVSSPHGTKTRTFAKRDQVAAEVAYFARCIREDREPEPSGWEGVADIRIIQALQDSARFGRTVSIEPLAPRRRPDLGQEIAIAPHDKAPLVDVDPPTQ